MSEGGSLGRRDFVAKTVAGVAGLAAGGLALTRLGPVPFGGVREAHAASVGAGGPRGSRQPVDRSASNSVGARALGVQLYTVRDRMAEDVAATLGAVAAIGYREVELAGLFDRTPAEFRALLDAEGLRAPSSHVGLNALEGDELERSLEAAAILGNAWLVLPWIGPAERTPDGIARVGEVLEAAGARAREAGVGIAYHNHDFEFEPWPQGGTPMRTLLERTDPELVHFQLDLYWIVHAGLDPLAALERHPGRYVSLHLKDRTQAGEMVAVGEGVIDFGTILPRAEALGVRHHFVEHDSPGDSLRSIGRSFAHLNALP